MVNLELFKKNVEDENLIEEKIGSEWSIFIKELFEKIIWEKVVIFDDKVFNEVQGINEEYLWSEINCIWMNLFLLNWEGQLDD